MKSTMTIIFLTCMLSGCVDDLATNKSMIAVGTYTKTEGHVDGKAEGIYLIEMDHNSGKLRIIDTIKNVVNPSYLSIADQSIYAVNELADSSDQPIGTMTKIDLNDPQQRKTIKVGGNAPCHITISPDNRFAITSNYVNTVSLIDISDDLSLKEVIIHKGNVNGPPRQESPHPHMSIWGPDNKTLLVSDLGLDQIIHYTIQKSALIEHGRTNITSGGGPRHMTMDNSTGIVYVLNELNHTIESYSWTDATTSMTRLQTISTLDNGVVNPNVKCSAIHLHPSGEFLYAANRGVNGDPEQSITAFKVNDDNTLSIIDRYPSKGLIPRDFAISPDGDFLLVANQNSDNIVVYKVQQDGTLIDVNVALKIKTPVCLKFY